MKCLNRSGLTAVALALLGCLCVPAAPPTTAPAANEPTDLSKQKTLYVVGYAHLDTQWRWAYPLVIREYIPNTLNRNFALMDKYPGYIFNFSGSRRYEMMKEYYPAEYEKLKSYVAAGRWFPCGSSVDENDANVPSGESLVRHVLYGNHFFRTEFGTCSHEYMLPDCFGFPAALPSVLAHCSIRGFSTQKLTWGSAVGIPFKVGEWKGVDGQSVIAALDPGAYTGTVREDLSKNDSWLARVNNTGKISGAFADYHYFGTGDTGGAPDEQSVDWINKSTAGNGPLKVVSSTAERMFLDITDAQKAKLPKYQGELLLTEHSAGAINSEAYMKRWNRKNELLADAAERASVAAAWMGGAPYPADRLYKAWVLVLGSQMHDMLPGTSLPKCYEYCWNDELLASNQFAAVETSGVGVVADQLDTRGSGVPLIVYNPLSIEREDVVEATVPLPGGPDAVSVIGPDGNATPAQVLGQSEQGTKIAFVAKVPSVGFASYDVRGGAASADQRSAAGTLKASEKSIENDRFRVTLNEAGDIASIYDKTNNRETLSAPIRMALLYENPANFPAWNMDWNDRKNPPRSYVSGPAQVRVIEKGPVRATLEVTRESEGSRFVQRISLAAGDAGDRVEVGNTIDWQTKERSLKATFPLTVANPKATYQIQVGALERGNNDPKKYEVPQHEWMDLTAPDASYGVAVLNDCKYGSDKPDDRTMRLTLVYTPGTRAGYHDQGTQDIGRHDILYALAPHAGDWRKGNVSWIAERLNQPLRAFTAPAHEGPLGKSFALLKVSSDQVTVAAIKKAEDSEEIVVRLKELTGKTASNVRVTAAGPIAAAREVDGQESELGAAKIDNGALVTELQPYHLRAFALKLGNAPARAAARDTQTISLPYDIDAASHDSNRADGDFDGQGRTLAADQLPPKLQCDGVGFGFGSTKDGEKNALVCRGQSIDVPAGYSRVYLLAAAIDGDQTATFKLGDKTITRTVQDWGGYVGQWDNRIWSVESPETARNVEGEMCGLVPGYVKPDEVAWFCSHRHHPTGGNEFYQYSYLFKYAFDVPSGATSITLPSNEKVRVFAMTLAKGTHDAIAAAHPLYDTLDDHRAAPTLASISPAGGKFNDITDVSLGHPLYWNTGGLHYTTDGNEPTMQAPVYSAPLRLATSTKLRVRQFDQAGNGGPEASANFDINDTTPPRVVSAQAVSILPEMRISFSEPLNKSQAQTAGNYHLTPDVPVTGAKLSDDGQTVTLALAKPLMANTRYHLAITNVGDASPAANKVQSSEALSVAVARPVFSLDSFIASGKAKEQKVAELPGGAKDPWTINLFVRTSEQPENRTIIAGFGHCDDASMGTGRYLSKFARGIHFWARNCDVDGLRTPIDLNTWQMLSATYDGQAVRLYKDGKQINERSVGLADEEDHTVRIAPNDPWDHQRQFRGEIRSFTIWNSALPAEALKVLQDAGPKGNEPAQPAAAADRQSP